MTRTTKPDESTLSPSQRDVLGKLKKGRTPGQIAKSRKTSTNAVYQTVRRLRAMGFDLPDHEAASGNGSAKRSTSSGRRRRPARPAPAPPAPEPEVAVLDPSARIREAKDAVEAERVTLSKQRENATEEREKLLAEAEARGTVIGEIDLGIARLDHVLAEFDAKVEVPS